MLNSKTMVAIRKKGRLPGVFEGYRKLKTGDYEKLVFTKEGKANVLRSAQIVFRPDLDHERAECIPYTTA